MTKRKKKSPTPKWDALLEKAKRLHAMSEDDVKERMAHAQEMIVTDTSAALRQILQEVVNTMDFSSFTFITDHKPTQTGVLYDE